ncbi:MFS transporter [Thiospirochaeta perfilievii]|uniref:MFS transporter n=1 Tax=Thiospirochaeta perfilievii TaxID=252967 RepID=A0A5C1QBP4_9SPIO|nr:MFS transporter [Thiospirochaeta perfilievii]QEN05495.1 MFS transporter [Thiospirochaeta perfilievii]
MKINKKILSWSLYDWANSAFATTVLAGFFPTFFRSYWSTGDSVDTTFYLGLASSISSLVVAVLAPFLGAIADKTSTKRKFLLFFSFIGIIMTGSLSLIQSGNWPMALMFFILASIGWSGGNLFYDSLIIGVAEQDEKMCDDVSALGFSLGYIGGGLLFLINVLMFKFPESFGFPNGIVAVKASFLSVAIWWAIFSIPLFIFVKEPKVDKKLSILGAIKAGLSQLKTTFKEIQKLKVVFTFLLAYFFYIDGVDTIIKMSVNYGASLGFKSESLIVALLITQFIAFPAVLIFNMIGRKVGVKNSLYGAIFAYSLITIAGLFMQNETHFYILAIFIGLFQGGVQAASRSYFTRLIPKDKAGEFFGFYNMLGKSAAILGPFLVAIVTKLTGSNRVGMISILLLFILGFIFLKRVNTEKGKELAQIL